MTARHSSTETQFRYHFEVEHEGKSYDVTIWMDEKGKFAGEEMRYPNGDELDHEGEEGEIREAIMDYLDENWNSLVD